MDPRYNDQSVFACREIFGVYSEGDQPRGLVVRASGY